MKRLLLQLLLPLFCFNLAGGYSIAAGLTNEQVVSESIAKLPVSGHAQLHKKDTSTLAAAAQVLKEMEEEAATEFQMALQKAPQIPVVFFNNANSGFSIQHYLSLYDRTIKVRQPHVHLLACVFII